MPNSKNKKRQNHKELDNLVTRFLFCKNLQVLWTNTYICKLLANLKLLFDGISPLIGKSYSNVDIIIEILVVCHFFLCNAGKERF